MDKNCHYGGVGQPLGHKESIYHIFSQRAQQNMRPNPNPFSTMAAESAKWLLRTWAFQTLTRQLPSMMRSGSIESLAHVKLRFSL